MHSAGTAVKTLTRSNNNSDDDPSKDPFVSADRQKQSFAAATSSYFSILSSVDVRLRRQIYALEEADILPAEASTREGQTNLSAPAGAPSLGAGPNAQPPRTLSKGVITGGGLGGLDVGWLNSRNDDVGKQKEAELWGEAEQFLGNFAKDDIEARGSSDLSG